MNLDAGHAVPHRSRLEVRQPDRGHADEHELPLQAARSDPPGQDVGGGDESRGIAPSIVEPHAAVRFRRNAQIADAHQGDARSGRAQRETRRAGGDPEHFRAEPRDEPSPRRGDEREAANDSGFHIHADKPVAGGGVVDLAHASQQRGKSPDEGTGVGTGDPHRCQPPRRVERVGSLQPGHSQHHRQAAKAGGEHGVVARQASQPLGEVAVQLGHQAGERARGETVGLGHEDVEADGGRPGGGDLRDEPGQERPRPRPLAVAGETVLVDLHDHGGRRHPRARQPELVGVEPGEPQDPEWPAIPGEEPEQECRQHQQPERPAPTAVKRTEPAPIGPVPWRGRRPDRQTVISRPS